MTRSPRYPLLLAQRAEVFIGQTCVLRANQVLQRECLQEARAFVHALVLALTPKDFSHTELMPQRVGRPRFGDVYGKLAAGTAWFIKIEFDGLSTTIVLSCHEAEAPLYLVDGRVLRPL